jgi:uncharacterized protein
MALQGGTDLTARYGGWALVTGASSGIGRAFGEQIAAAGMPCLLLANDADGLAEARDEIARRCDVEVEALCLDLAEPDVVARIVDAVGNRDVGVVVSNASFGVTGPFVETDLTAYRRLLAVNVDAYTALSLEFLPRLQRRGRGALLIVSSFNSLVPGMGRSAVYTASKAFETSLACGLWQETMGTDVDVLLVLPGPTKTGFQHTAGTQVASWAMEPGEVAAGALAEIGQRLLHVAGETNQLLATRLEQLSIERRVAIASALLDEALLKGQL